MRKEGLSVVIRSRKNEDLGKTLGALHYELSNREGLEVIVVSLSDEYREFSSNKVKYIFCNAKRIEAKKIGVERSSYNYVMFLDSDQIVSHTLLGKLLGCSADMVMIPERSSSRDIMSRILNSKRRSTEGKAKKTIDPALPVVPRMFRSSLLEKVFKSLPDFVVKNVTETEDSLIFYEALKFSSDIEWVDDFIYNDDPNILSFIKKSFEYGVKNERSIINGNLPEEYVRLIRKIQFETLINNRTLSIGSFVNNVLRGVPYTIGSMKSRMKKVGK